MNKNLQIFIFEDLSKIFRKTVFQDTPDWLLHAATNVWCERPDMD